VKICKETIEPDWQSAVIWLLRKLQEHVISASFPCQSGKMMATLVHVSGQEN
jgi:hypothetical protein